MEIPNKQVLQNLYRNIENSSSRYKYLAKQYRTIFGNNEMEFFSAPGRTEIIGNHTDHNGGKVLAASINMDTIAAAFPNHSDIIEIVSEGYEKKITINLNHLNAVPINQGTLSLIAGIAKATIKFGYKISGFQAYISTDVISSAGVSSSASFEMLLCTIINYFFNDNNMSYITYAKIGQYAENTYWEKASGLMDQMACAVGGTILLDFKKDVTYQSIDFDFSKLNEQLVIINTGKGHANLSKEYSEIPSEMIRVANSMGYERLCDTNFDTLLENLTSIEKKIKNDRAILRAIHFFEENQRVESIIKAIQVNDRKKISELITSSGKSSWELLQNCYTISDYKTQKIGLILSLTEKFLNSIDGGCCRVHGGGFAGVIATILPQKYTESYTQFISEFVDRSNVYPMDIRQAGAVHLKR